MNKKRYHDSIMLEILAKSVEHYIDEAAMAVGEELCSRCPVEAGECYKPCVMYQQNFDIAMTRLISLTAQWN
jgi:hypothetical protein